MFIWFVAFGFVFTPPPLFFFKGVHNTTIRDIDIRSIMDLMMESKDQSKKKVN